MSSKDRVLGRSRFKFCGYKIESILVIVLPHSSQSSVVDSNAMQEGNGNFTHIVLVMHIV